MAAQAALADARDQVQERTYEVQACGEEIVRLRMELQRTRQECKKLKQDLEREQSRDTELDREVRLQLHSPVPASIMGCVRVRVRACRWMPSCRSV